MDLEPYQQRVVDWLSRRRRGLVASPAGSGKTVMAAAALAAVLARRARSRRVVVGWQCGTREQREQALAALAKFPAVAEAADTTVSCDVQGCDWSGCDVLVVDEAHHAAAQGWARKIAGCAGAVWGLTATPDTGDPERNRVLAETFGEAYTVERGEVAARLVGATVRWLDPQCPGVGEAVKAEIERLLPVRRRQMPWAPEGEVYRQVAWQACVEVGVVANEQRNSEARAAAVVSLAEGRRLLVLVNRVQHARWFVDRLGSEALPCHSSLGKPRRARAVELFQAGDKVRCLVATSLADEGLDLPMADTLVLVSAGRSRRAAEQRTGRVLRTFAGKSSAVIYDFKDTFYSLMDKHAQARSVVYRKLGYEQVQWVGGKEM